MFNRFRRRKSMDARVQAALLVKFPELVFRATEDGSFNMFAGAGGSFLGQVANHKGTIWVSLALDSTGAVAGRICEAISGVGRFKHSEAVCIADDAGTIIYNEEAVAHFVRQTLGIATPATKKGTANVKVLH
jgi:hypothetical protein